MKTTALATVKDGYNGDIATVHVSVHGANPFRVYAAHAHGSYCLGTMLDRHAENPDGLAQYLSEHSAVVGFTLRQ